MQLKLNTNPRTFSFNTQPPEGGWRHTASRVVFQRVFQHTAARRRLAERKIIAFAGVKFQHTAARRRLVMLTVRKHPHFCFNTQPPEGGWRDGQARLDCRWSFNTQPPEGGWVYAAAVFNHGTAFQHTAARRRLDGCSRLQVLNQEFQHTAARRRLVPSGMALSSNPRFQHTAARRRLEPLSKALPHQVSQP